MFIRRAYYYLFYTLYKFWEAISIPKFWSDWKAELSLDVLEIFLGLSGICYYAIVNKEIIDFGSGRYIVCLYLLLIAIPNYFIFHHHDQWKQIVHEFDQLPKKNNINWRTCCVDYNFTDYRQFGLCILSVRSN